MGLCHIFFALLLATVSFNPAAAAPSEETADQKLLSRISLSFSKLPLNIQRKDLKMRLADLHDANCYDNFNCYYIDKNNIAHYFDGNNNQLYKKTFGMIFLNSDDTTKPLEILGIGMSRKKADVLKSVTRFLNGASYSCEDDSSSAIIVTNCKWSLKGGYVSMEFSALVNPPKAMKLKGGVETLDEIEFAITP